MCISVLFFLSFFLLLSVIFNVDPDTHIDSIDQAEGAVLEGTANWSAKIAVTGIPMLVVIIFDRPPNHTPTNFRPILFALFAQMTAT